MFKGSRAQNRVLNFANSEVKECVIFFVHGSRSTPPFLRTQCQGHVPPSAENAAAVVKKP